MPKTASVLAALTLVAAASAQTRPAKPFHVELGLYLPTVGSGADTDPGVALTLGGIVYQRNGLELGADLRGSFYGISGGGESGDVTISSMLATARYRPLGSKAFVGIGLGAARADVSANGLRFTSDTEFAYSAEIGVDVAKSTYLLARYQGGSNEGFRGVTLGAGYRF